ncbi:MAG: iron-containing alcohol dehydrogenase [Actinobacteria bacterium]|nr:iron-containing alcohol dehydrogenase [Actinomycetota bacterium]
MNNSQKIKSKAGNLLRQFKGSSYIFGLNTIEKAGCLAQKLGIRSVLSVSSSAWAKDFKAALLKSLLERNIDILETIDSARPNSPVEDVYYLKEVIEKIRPDFVIAAGGGSTIDCAKAAAFLAALSPSVNDIEPYFGTGLVTRQIKNSGKKPYPLFAVQMSASSSAHLTKYSNVTDLKTKQKKLIVDDAIVPPVCLFDYSVTTSMGSELTIDGVLDGISHLIEVYYGADYEKNPENYKRIEDVALTGLKLLVDNLPKVLKKSNDLKIRELIGLGTDLGGYAIMLGGTNGAHLASFSLTDILSHGRACGIMNPYWTVFFAPAIRRQLLKLIDVFSGYLDKGEDIDKIRGGNKIPDKISDLPSRRLGEIAGGAMRNFLKSAKVPDTLAKVHGFKVEHIERAISNAKNPQLEMKLKNMPVSLNAGLIDKYMKPVLKAAEAGDFSIIKNLS